MIEEWRPITGYEESHEVSNFGNVRSIDRVIETNSRWGTRRKEKRKGRQLSSFMNKDGYPCVHIKRDRRQKEFKIHRIVALAFLGEPGEGMEVNHIDGDKTNNHVSNLEWVTHKENMVHNFKVLGYDYTGRMGRAGRLIKCIDTGEIFPSETEVARAHGGTQGGVWYALNKGHGVYRGKKYKIIS